MCKKTASESSKLIPLAPVWQKLARTLETTVRVTRYSANAGQIQNFLDMVVCPIQPEFIQLHSAIEGLYTLEGQIPVEALAASIGLSRRQMERQFKENIGLSPKRLARLIRFEAVRDQLLREPQYRLHDLSFEFGYTDQAHFIHDFKAIAEYTPGEFATLTLEGKTTGVHQVFQPHILYMQCLLS
ncbi:helix-turn-helix domain-containing protein [Leptolyngbya sp. 7M]|jgi:AraC-like DNA-binding protein|uniref:helix-turn-helix domain-containing protein n=1 Tax=Leptolyngbya sp. 7M TaxID=2812896 RepID=UPI001B8AD94D|nr:helix-turn-helix domain-containing protein [Leptolyngbya sp. 7M]QYO63173.1 helix-turn-helix domain-containing protein [Leptolyngbya sp. 7M]